MKSIVPTRLCKICFKEYNEQSMFHLLTDYHICMQCYREMRPTFTKFKVGKYKALAIYEYSDRIKSLLYQFKGCFDIEIFDVFLSKYARELRLIYDGFVIVPIPSYKEDDETREFNHVIEMFKILNLKMVNVLIKNKKVKQADLSFKQRKQIVKFLELNNGEVLKNKKVLLVDDVYTTGSTMAAAVSLIEECHPKKIEILVMSKTSFKDNEKE